MLEVVVVQQEVVHLELQVELEEVAQVEFIHQALQQQQVRQILAEVEVAEMVIMSKMVLQEEKELLY
jgi:hypothetical protein